MRGRGVGWRWEGAVGPPGESVGPARLRTVLPGGVQTSAIVPQAPSVALEAGGSVAFLDAPKPSAPAAAWQGTELQIPGGPQPQPRRPAAQDGRSWEL